MKPPDTLLTAPATRRNAPEQVAALEYLRRYMRAWNERMTRLLEADANGGQLTDIERRWVENRKGRV